MGEGQLRYSTDYSGEYFSKYRQKIPRTPGLFYGDDRNVLFKSTNGLIYGLFAGTAMSGFIITQDTPLLANAHYKAFRYGVPCVLAGATYGVTVGLLAEMRGKSDGFNHLTAGLVSGQILGGWFKSMQLGRWYSIILAGVGFLMKEFADADSLISDPVSGLLPLNFYRIGLFTERPDLEGVKDSS